MVELLDVSNRVLSNLKKHVSDICSEIGDDSSKTPAKFPYMGVVQIDSPDYAMDLENTENAVQSVVEIQVFSNKNITETKTIINKACDGMRIMGYVRNYGPMKISNAADTNIYRMVARFRRIVSSVDEIEKFN